MRVTLFALAACTSDVPPPVLPPALPQWTLARHDEPAALLSVWGADADDVWVVGGRTELAGGPTVLHYVDGWTPVDTGALSLDLWWVFGLSADDIFFGGTGGTILRRRQGPFERMTTPDASTIFGIWGATENDMWAVGGGGAAGGVVWRFDGTQWSAVPLPAGMPDFVFKVDGIAADDVWMSCSDGSVLHWNGAALERQATGAAAPLFSIAATSNLVVAVGGTGDAQIAEHTSEWALASLPVSRFRGVAERGATFYAVGELGTVATRDASAWRIVEQHVTSSNFHAAWIDPDEGVWAVGGQFNTKPLTSGGFVTYFGTREVSP